MDKLEVGQYVRTKKGIFQIRNKDVFIENKKQYLGVNGRYTCIDIETIEKASHNIIDLIEVGDYVNGKQVIDKWEEPFGAFAGEIFIKLAGEDAVPTMRKIESVVTKEQFKNMEYRIGD